MVWYWVDQSTDSPSRRQTCSNACSSRLVSRSQRATKLRREIRTGSPAGRSGGTKSGS